MKHKIIVINGPNLNLLGEREKEKYGSVTLKSIEENCSNFSNKNNIELSFFQSNLEGELVDIIQKSRNKHDGVIINAAGYTHTSVSIRDALAILKVPKIELHITNIYNRENFRHKSLISNVVNGIICGFGPNGYLIALDALKNILKNEN
jgi:3-dehydroquinate dehydratase II